MQSSLRFAAELRLAGAARAYAAALPPPDDAAPPDGGGGRRGRAHCLVAAGTDASAVRLCDLASGATAHALTGHTEAVLCCAWSPADEHVLASGARARSRARSIARALCAPRKPRSQSPSRLSQGRPITP